MDKNATTDVARWAKVWSMVDDIKTAMMTTVEGDLLVSRPMRGVTEPDAGEIWFFTSLDSAKVEDVRDDKRVSVTYADHRDESYVALSGTMTVKRDREKIDAYWNTYVAAWFPKGKKDPNVALLRFDVERAEYWDITSSRMVQLVKLATARVTSTTPNLGDHATVER